MNAALHSERLLGESPAFLEVLDHVSQVAPLSKPVLIVGERGTGKELIAARLHYLSTRWDQQYIKMNCAAISETLLETELFGHEAGAFTGATKMHRGRFERADKGSLFLDELATTSALVQEKLLRIIEYGEYERVGGSQTLTTDVRLIAATNEDKHEFRMSVLQSLRNLDDVFLALLRVVQCTDVADDPFSGITGPDSLDRLVIDRQAAAATVDNAASDAIIEFAHDSRDIGGHGCDGRSSNVGAARQPAPADRIVDAARHDIGRSGCLVPQPAHIHAPALV